MAVRQFAHTLCHLVAPPDPTHIRLVCTRLGCTRSAAQGLEKCVKLDSLNSCFVDVPWLYVAKPEHFLRVLMYPGFLSGGPGAGKPTIVYIIQFQCNHVVVVQNLCFIRRRRHFCYDVNVYWFVSCCSFVICRTTSPNFYTISRKS